MATRDSYICDAADAKQRRAWRQKRWQLRDPNRDLLRKLSEALDAPHISSQPPTAIVMADPDRWPAEIQALAQHGTQSATLVSV